MHYELVSRALAYVSCLTALSLFATSMAITAVNVGKLKTHAQCDTAPCAVLAAKPVAMARVDGLEADQPLESVAVMVRHD